MVNCEAIVEAINKEVEVADLKRVCMKNGMKTMHQDSMLKVKFGLTTMEDALSNVPADMIAMDGGGDEPAEGKAKKGHGH
jgi:type II secretory ATPase GspE/PulE/Tfp pilus assembly ATPase PilB-like protein